MYKYSECVEKLMGHFTSGEFEKEALEAKKEFFQYAGTFDEESDQFEQKVSQFTDWFLFSRPLLKYGEPPVDTNIKHRTIDMSEEDRFYFESLTQSRHSLFEFLKLKGSDVYIKDLFLNEKIIVKDSDITQGFEKKQIFEARLFPHEGSYVFSSAFCFHPEKAEKFINKEIKKVKKLKVAEEKERDKEELIFKLFKMHYKYQQYSHVDVLQIYSNEPKLNL